MFGENYVKLQLAQRHCVHALLQEIEIQITAYTSLMNRVRNSKVSKADSKYRYVVIPKLTVRSDKYNPDEIPQSSVQSPRIRWYQYESVRRTGSNKIAREVKSNKTGYTVNTFMKYAPVEIAKLAFETEQILNEYRSLISDLHLVNRSKLRINKMEGLRDELSEAYEKQKMDTEN